MKTIDEQIECAKALLASLKEQKAEQEATAVKAAEPQLPKAWMPKMRNDYYAISSDGEIDSCSWYADDVDVGRYSLGNVYKTCKEAEFEVERRKVETELRKYIYEHGGGDGEYVMGEKNLCIEYDTLNECICVAMAREFIRAEIYSQAKAEVLWAAIHEIGEDRIKKYYLRVKK